MTIVISGCETAKLWSESPNGGFVKIVATTPEDDVEVALKQSGREYYCQDLYASTHPNNKVCFAKFTTEAKLQDTQVKLLKTPETLVLDAGHTIKVVGSVAFDIIIHSMPPRG